MALLIVPCSDAKSCVQTIDDSKNVAHFHNQEHEDNCTPFCECVCCGVTIADYQLKQIEDVVPMQFISSERIIIRVYKITSKYSVSIWQPPKFYS